MFLRDIEREHWRKNDKVVTFLKKESSCSYLLREFAETLFIENSWLIASVGTTYSNICRFKAMINFILDKDRTWT